MLNDMLYFFTESCCHLDVLDLIEVIFLHFLNDVIDQFALADVVHALLLLELFHGLGDDEGELLVFIVGNSYLLCYCGRRLWNLSGISSGHECVSLSRLKLVFSSLVFMSQLVDLLLELGLQNDILLNDSNIAVSQ